MNGSSLSSTTPVGSSSASNGAVSLGSVGPPTAPPNDSWRPIVLSLDGGGIRGLSSLYIIREIMVEIDKEVRKHEPQSRASAHSTLSVSPLKSVTEAEHSTVHKNPELEDGDDGVRENLPLPCRYFDFMVGTSTGGLIAIMLGRLRMDIDECIRAYLKLGNSIFRPQSKTPLRYISKRFQYSPKKLTEAVEEVLRDHCRCQHKNVDACVNQYLRQWDYAEQGDIVSESEFNGTCKAAVVTLREGGGNSHGERSGDVNYLFRTYNHRARSGPFRGDEWNPRILDNSTLTIVEACRATTAAPTWFPPVKLRGRKFIDGGVTNHNNPSQLAWHEATVMAHQPSDAFDEDKSPRVLLSVGTGKVKESRKIGLLNILHAMKNKFMDTEEVHKNLPSSIKGFCTYWRFNVPESKSRRKKTGLDHIKLDQCKKTRRKSRLPFRKHTATDNEDVGELERSIHDPKKGGYKPNKYHYSTYDDIKLRTLDYCRGTGDENISGKIKESAKLLYDLSQEREKADNVRWGKFWKHPKTPHRKDSPSTGA
ncbi:hypothetical protein G7054_g3728 [Neopestalotiopsis clavispora]|nr:hypothetical protein G7054_g3728 [Neopestalotiopsis clavispora]